MLGRQADRYLEYQRAAHLQRTRELTDSSVRPIRSACCSPTTRYSA